MTSTAEKIIIIGGASEKNETPVRVDTVETARELIAAEGDDGDARKKRDAGWHMLFRCVGEEDNDLTWANIVEELIENEDDIRIGVGTKFLNLSDDGEASGQFKAHFTKRFHSALTEIVLLNDGEAIQENKLRKLIFRVVADASMAGVNVTKLSWHWWERFGFMNISVRRAVVDNYRFVGGQPIGVYQAESDAMSELGWAVEFRRGATVYKKDDVEIVRQYDDVVPVVAKSNGNGAFQKPAANGSALEGEASGGKGRHKSRKKGKQSTKSAARAKQAAEAASAAA